MSWVRYLTTPGPLGLTFPYIILVLALRLSGAGLRAVGHRRQHPVRGGPEPRRELVDRHHPDHRAQHALGDPVGGRAVGRARARRVHARLAVLLRESAGRRGQLFGLSNSNVSVAASLAMLVLGIRAAVRHLVLRQPAQTSGVISHDRVIDAGGGHVASSERCRGQARQPHPGVRLLQGTGRPRPDPRARASWSPCSARRAAARPRRCASWPGSTARPRARSLVGGKDVSNVPANKRDMGMVFQAYSLFPHMTARQNVEFGLKLRKVSAAKRKERAMEMLVARRTRDLQ